MTFRKYCVVNFLCFLPLATLPASAEAPVVAVFGFCGSTKNQEIVANAFTSVVTQALSNSGKFELMKASAVVRAVDEKGGISALADEKVVEALAHEMACQYVVFGEVLNAEADSVKFSGYGVTSFKTTFNLKVSLKVLNVYNKTIVFAKMLENASPPQVNINTSPGFSAGIFINLSKEASKSVSSPMLAALLKDIRNDQLSQQNELQSQNALQPSAATKAVPDEFTIKLNCNVPDAYVEIDGVIEGQCSDQFSVSSGLHEIVVTARNFMPSKIKIRVTKNTVLPVSLTRSDKD